MSATSRSLAEHLTLEWPFINNDTNRVVCFLNRALDVMVRDYDARIARGNPWTLGYSNLESERSVAMILPAPSSTV